MEEEEEEERAELREAVEILRSPCTGQLSPQMILTHGSFVKLELEFEFCVLTPFLFKIFFDVVLTS